MTKSEAIELTKTAEALSDLAMKQKAKIKRLQAEVARLKKKLAACEEQTTAV